MAPDPHEDRSVLGRVVREPDERIVFGSDPSDHADVFRCVGDPEGLVICIHGGFWRPEFDARHLHPMGAGLADARWDAALLEYPRRPGDPDATAQAIVRGYRALLPHARGRRIVLVGHSAGGHLALWMTQHGLAGDDRPPDALIALAPVTDLTAAHDAMLDDGAVADFLGAHPGDRPDLDPMKSPIPRSPFTILHGTHDIRVPVEHSRAFLDRVGPAGRLIVLPDADHFALIDPRSRIWPEVLEAIRET